MRPGNEDSLYACGVVLPGEYGGAALNGQAGAGSVFAVFDGMGGEEAGAAASHIAAEGMRGTAQLLASAPVKKMEDILAEYVRQVTAETAKISLRSGTTMALAVIRDEGICCFSLGDSRIYLLQNGQLRQITRDHTLQEDLLDRGVPPDMIPRGADHALTRCVGMGEADTPDVFTPVRGDAKMLICSDGLYDMVDDRAIRKTLMEKGDPAEAADSLVSQAMAGGGRDNISVITADIRPGGFSLSRLFHTPVALPQVAGRNTKPKPERKPKDRKKKDRKKGGKSL